MIGEVIVVGDLKLRENAPLDEYNRLGERMYDIVSRLPGFLSVNHSGRRMARSSPCFALPRSKHSKPGAIIPTMSKP
ncbi:hypothetical protein [Bradyrhizobium australafricanum]|uniref:hypothetical protein n=1 Tax=Bradyrhizobium australafricanum TaxID=2821406 RepID=UPI001CE2E531|nr:hypothetical protein [Bradyrhizobium australafricanum]